MSHPLTTEELARCAAQLRTVRPYKQHGAYCYHGVHWKVEAEADRFLAQHGVALGGRLLADRKEFHGGRQPEPTEAERRPVDNIIRGALEGRMGALRAKGPSFEQDLAGVHVITELLDRLDISQKDIARVVGISEPKLSRIVKRVGGKRRPAPDFPREKFKEIPYSPVLEHPGQRVDPLSWIANSRGGFIRVNGHWVERAANGVEHPNVGGVRPDGSYEVVPDTGDWAKGMNFGPPAARGLVKKFPRKFRRATDEVYPKTKVA